MDSGAVVRFTPLSGAHDETPPCYLLEIGDCKILLDAGWSYPYDVNLLKPLSRVAPTVDFVLLSHPDTLHLGALPYAVSKLGLDCPIYATTPVHHMGQMFLYDAYLSARYNGDFELFNPDDIDAVFEKIIQLKFSQHVTLTGKGEGIEVTPYSAGHMLGGSLWRIKVGMDEIIYASDYNHKRERHLNKGMLVTLQRPMLLICDAFNAQVHHSEKRADRDKKLVTQIMDTFRRGGNVLIPMDSAGRVLELLVLLDNIWTMNRIGTYSLVFLSSQAYNTTNAATTQLEWMSDMIQKAFQNSSSLPLTLPNVKRCHNPDELQQITGPMVVLATQPDLEHGFAREVFVNWASNENNMIVLTQRTAKGSLARKLIDGEGSADLRLHITKRVNLSGDELVRYTRRKEIARLQALERERLEEQKREMVEAQQEEDEGEEEMMAVDLIIEENPYFKKGHDLVIPPERLPTPFPMFPFTVSTDLISYGATEKSNAAGEWSAYGTIIDPDTYKIEDEDDGIKPMEVDTARDDELTVKEVPSKLVPYDLDIKVAARIQFIDFEGRSDGRSMQAILKSVQPRSAIFVRGSMQSIEMMKEFAMTELHVPRVHTPDVDQTVDATTETNMYAIQLSDSLSQRIHWHLIDDYEIGFVSSQVHAIESVDGAETRVLGALRTAEDDDETEGDSATPMDIEKRVPALAPVEKLSHRTVFVGQPALKDVRALLHNRGFRAEFVSGTLVVNDAINVRKDGTNAKGMPVFRVEGAFCEDYFSVRDLVYTQFTML